MKAYPGHFATNHSHINYYLDITPIKCRHTEAQLVAKEFVREYKHTKAVDTIVSMNTHECVNIVTPEINTSGQIIFRDNVEAMLTNKHVVLLLASATTGQTVEQSIQAIRYYGGNVQGVSAIFTAVDEVEGIPVHSIYHVDDVGSYKNYLPSECPYCKEKRKLDAIVNSYGYSKI